MGLPDCPLLKEHREDIGSIEVSSGVSKIKCTIKWTSTAPLKQQILCATASWTVA